MDSFKDTAPSGGSDEIAPWISTTDPKVVISNLSSVFKAAARKRFGFVILQIQRSAEEMQILRSGFGKIGALLDDPSGARPKINVYGGREINLDTSSFDQRIDKAKMQKLIPEFLRMAGYYHEITGLRNFAIQFGRTMKTPLHDHHDPVISCCWGDNGLIVPLARNLPGETQLLEGDYGFLQASTLHHSPQRIKPSVTAIAMPEVQR